MSRNRLYKKEKLCSSVAIDSLFGKAADSHTALAFPIRAVWRENPGRRSDATIQFMISVPKKRLRHAVDRVLMRRRVRESYRLSQRGAMLPEGFRIDLILIYVANNLQPYDKVRRSVERLLNAITAQANQSSSITQDDVSANTSNATVD